jgi:hypothetical protein
MLNSGKKIALCATKKNNIQDSCTYNAWLTQKINENFVRDH